MSNCPYSHSGGRLQGLRCAWLAAAALCAYGEYQRWHTSELDPPTQLLWTNWNIDTTPFVPLLLFAIPVLFIRRARSNSTQPSSSPPISSPRSDSPSRTHTPGHDRASDSRVRNWSVADTLIAIALFGGSIFVDSRVAAIPVGPRNQAWTELPPAYHDEFSYLFMARTFASSRTWYASHPEVPEAFDQMHVLNDGKFASRYFPGTGLWITPFWAGGHPHWAHWVAGGLATVCLFGAGRELSGRGVGTLAGILFAVSPAVGLFSNLYLAHHPTLLGLSLFLWSMLCVMRSPSLLASAAAGVGLTAAMLCRPMTAAGFALPFGCWWLAWLCGRVRPSGIPIGRRLQVTGAMAVCLLVGLAGLYFYNRTITGNGWESPYQRYTDRHTPRHVYGFNNVERGERNLGPEVIEAYDRWAENLTWSGAVRNVARRWWALWGWTLGTVPLLAVTCLTLANANKLALRWKLTALTIISLHAAHVPYWFTGIMDFHYVFESVLGWCLLAAAAGVAVERRAARRWQAAATAWLTAFLFAALIPSYFSLEPLWSGSRVQAAVNTAAFSKLKYERLRRLVQPALTAAQRQGKQLLVCVQVDPEQVHLDYIDNAPTLDGPIVFARCPTDPERLQRLVESFPNRHVVVFDAKTETLLLRRDFP